MLETLLGELRHAAENLKTVANALKTPLDTATFDRALLALEKHLLPMVPESVDKLANKVIEPIVEPEVEKAIEFVEEKTGLKSVLDKITKSE